MTTRRLTIVLVAASLVLGATVTWALTPQAPAPVVMDEPAEAPIEEPAEPEIKPIPRMLVFTAYGTKTAIRTDLVRTITESPKGTFISWEGQDNGTIAEESFEELLTKLDYATDRE